MFDILREAKNICPEKLKGFDGLFGGFLVETLPTSDIMLE
jgi:hypothetical protein